MNPLCRLEEFGQSVWYDNIHRAMIRSGELHRMIQEDGLKGVTSNPTIFEKAITGSNDYDGAIEEHLRKQWGMTARDLFFALAIEDIQNAADVLRPVYERSGGKDGMISLEVSPDLAFNTEGTVAEAKRLWSRVNRDNVMIKVPATKQGIPAIESLIAEGINVNVTLIFSIDRYKEVAEAYLLGLESRLRRGLPIAKIASVASFFVSRIDNLLDQKIDERLKKGGLDPNIETRLKKIQGQVGIANAKLAYLTYKSLFNSTRFKKLADAGAKSQRLLWASTGTKNPRFSDVLYIDNLIGPDTVNTVPPATYKAFKDHGNPAAMLEKDVEGAQRVIAELKELGFDLDAMTQQLEKEGVDSFAKSFTTLLAALNKKISILSRHMWSSDAEAYA